MTVTEVREQLLELSRTGDDLRGSDFADIQDWHADVVSYVRSALGDGPADDVANRLQCRRGSTQAEKESNAVGMVTDWIGIQVVGLAPDKIVATLEVSPELEEEHGDIWQAAGSADDPTGVEPESGGAAEVGGGVPAESQPADGSENLE